MLDNFFFCKTVNMSNIWAYLAKLTLIFKLQTTSAVHLEQLHYEPYVGCRCDAFVKRCVILSVGKSATAPSGAACSPTDRCQMGTMRLYELFFSCFFFVLGCRRHWDPAWRVTGSRCVCCRRPDWCVHHWPPPHRRPRMQSLQNGKLPVIQWHRKKQLWWMRPEGTLTSVVTETGGCCSGPAAGPLGPASKLWNVAFVN